MNVASIVHFARVATRGAHPAASSGEKVANKVAKALHRIGDDLAVLDADSIDGIRDLIQAMAGPWPTDAAKSAVFKTIRNAATGKA
jgi:hypothetical protein